MTREEALERFSRPKWRIQRIIHHELHPWEPTSLSLAQKAKKGGRVHARDRRIKKLLDSILAARRAD